MRNIVSDDPAGCRAAAFFLERGLVIAIPGVTNYSLAVDARNDEAVRRLKRLTGCSASEPPALIVPPAHVERYVDLPDSVEGLLSLMGNALVLVAPARSSANVPFIVHPETKALGVFWLRIQAHRLLYQFARCPIAVASMPRAVQPKPCRVLDIVELFGRDVDLVINGGDVPLPRESLTILNVSLQPPRIVQQGFIDRKLLRSFVPGVEEAS